MLFGRNVLQQGLRNCFILPDSELYDAVLCSAIADVNMDGRHEIVLGTYSQVRQYSGFQNGIKIKVKCNIVYVHAVKVYWRPRSRAPLIIHISTR